MKTLHRNRIFAGIALLFPLALPGAPAVSSAPADQPAVEPKTHFLFSGVDVVVERDKKLCRVWDVAGSSFIVTLDGVTTTVPMGGGSRNLKLEQAMKLTSTAATLTGLKGERAYSPRNDPRMVRQKEQMQVVAAAGDAASLAMGQFTVAQNQHAQALAAVADPRDPASVAGVAKQIADTQAASDAAFRANEMATAQMNSDLASGAAARNRADSDLAKENYDAIDVSFEVSSERQLTKPYVVAITRFRARNAPTGGLANTAIYAKELNPIGSKPQKVSFTQGGFPWGYTLEGFEVHLYDHGIEIATNVAPNQVALTREDAFRYLKIEYLSKHKGDTRPASLAMKKIAPGAKSADPSEQSNEFYFIKVSKEGMPLATFRDEACTQPADTATEAIAANFRFFPALEKGRQVEGVAKVLLPRHEM